MTAVRDDAVILKSSGTLGREYIDAIEHYRVFPTFLNGRESALAWIDAGGST